MKINPFYLAGILIIGPSVIATIMMDKTPSNHETRTNQLKKQQKTPEQIAKENAACKLDLHCWGNKHIASPGFICKKSIEKLSKYDFEWTDGVFEKKFSRFKWKNQKLGYLTYVGDKIKFQNGFGAWQNMIYSCDIDPDNGTVMDVMALPGRL
jgi:hypothetical protein